MFLPSWSYTGTDPGLKLFTLANQLLPEVPHCSKVFELGASDTDFIERVYNLRPAWKVAGMDWRETGRSLVVRGDVLTAPIPLAHVYIGLSAIEHVGLGHYELDPLDPYGDIKAVQRMRENTLPGGFIYLDVPYAPEGYWQHKTKCRVYDDVSLSERFGPHEVLGYTTSDVEGWIEKPVKNATGPRPYYYVAICVRKE